MTNQSPLQYFDPAAHGREQSRESAIAAKAVECARGMIWVPGKTSQFFPRRLRELNDAMRQVFAKVQSSGSAIHAVADEQRWLEENVELLHSELALLQEADEGLEKTEHVRRDRELVPRALVVAESLIEALHYDFDDSGFVDFMREFQSIVVLRVCELWEMVPALKFVLLGRIAEAVLGTGEAARTGRPAISACIRSLRAMDQTPWGELLESLIVFDEVLRRDPAGAYAKMDAQSRGRYRQEVVHLAYHSDRSELEIAELAIMLAQQSLREPVSDPRMALRRSHVGYYLLAEGRELLYRRANIRVPLRDRVQAFLRRYPDEFYLVGIEILALGMVLTVMWSVNFGSLWAALIAALALVIPCSQAAVEIMNYLTTMLLDPQALPKLDLSRGVPEDCTTMVVVPTLLLNEKQVRQLVKELEVRYVGNMSANLHFALLTDLPDSAEQPREDDPLVDVCGDLIRELNHKYAGNGAGTFAMFHRHRVYNRSEGVWMGWERKRGKLLDFNKLIFGDYDSFPYKVGDLSILPRVRYVLTLDSDTELPRGTAHRLIGTLAHPLCQAIIDREKNVVVQGYGMLQPRVGVSVTSTAQSRLASIYSGLTGFDIYTNAVSDVYQDLYGEGTFVGKGLYEVSTVHRVLDKRFPRNAILSHDLIEGAYTRAGLVSDVELIDSYPSHYSAYVRRKHRWVRGDWQIVEWLFPRVPDESGRRIRNPISVISRWKILDNLRRSVVEPATVALFLVGWIIPGRALYWTLAVLGILFVPTVFQLVAGLINAALSLSSAAVKQTFDGFATGLVGVLLRITFLLHDALVGTDAIWRSLYRSVVSRERLLQWETAAQAEAGTKTRTPIDLYMLSTPAIALAMVAAIYLVHRPALWVAVPILAIWACSKLISVWLDRPPRLGRKPATRKDELFLRRTSLRTWRYFAEFSTQEHNWLIPDNVQEEPAQVAARISPTNLGFLLNARQAACELGYLTVPEFVEQTRRTLETMNRLPLHRGHLLNWYDTRTLAPLPPAFVSTVDSGNLAASLVALNHGCRALLEKPLLSPALFRGYDDHLRTLADLNACSSWRTRRAIRRRNSLPPVQHTLAILSDRIVIREPRKGHADGARWFGEQLGARRRALETMLAEYMPWWLPEFECVRGSAIANSGVDVPLSQLPAFIRDLQSRLHAASSDTGVTDHDRQQCAHLVDSLSEVHTRVRNLVQALTEISDEAERWFARMDFSFLLDRRRKLLSIGYMADATQLHPACYDLLASEARIAAFIAIAKGDIPQNVWFRLGRTHVPAGGGPTLVSWAGTMFEYLMPAIWLRSYRDTLLQRSMERAVKTHQLYAAKKGVPWGISESGYCELNDLGSYGYRFFGVPELAMQRTENERLVVAPYSTAMAVSVDAPEALKNLRRMVNRGWFGEYGFYEAADFGSGTSTRRCSVVRSWMAHHQGMILLSMANFLCGDVVPQWFHRDVYVQATELLLQERIVVRHVRPAWHIKPPVKASRFTAVPGSQLALES